MALLVIGGPVWDHYEFKRLKASRDPRRKVKLYGKMLAAQWTFSALALLAAGRGLWFAPPATDWPWLATEHARSFALGLAAGIAVVMALPFFSLGKPRARAAVRKALARFNFFLPSEKFEYPWWAVLAITAGICEEWICRGFVLHYLVVAPWRTNLGTALILSAAIFGLNHLYQGLSGMVSAGVLGLALALMYLATGTLLAPMLLHAFIDLRVLGLIAGSRPRPGD